MNQESHKAKPISYDNAHKWLKSEQLKRNLG